MVVGDSGDVLKLMSPVPHLEPGELPLSPESSHRGASFTDLVEGEWDDEEDPKEGEEGEDRDMGHGASGL